MMYWFGGDVSGWGYVLMLLSMAVFWGLLITGLVLLFRVDGRQQTVTPEQVLAQRFARGELDDVEYRDRLLTLHQGVRS
jgi:putative membrane protein